MTQDKFGKYLFPCVIVGLCLFLTTGCERPKRVKTQADSAVQGGADYQSYPNEYGDAECLSYGKQDEQPKRSEMQAHPAVQGGADKPISSVEIYDSSPLVQGGADKPSPSVEVYTPRPFLQGGADKPSPSVEVYTPRPFLQGGADKPSPSVDVYNPRHFLQRRADYQPCPNEYGGTEYWSNGKQDEQVDEEWLDEIIEGYEKQIQDVTELEQEARDEGMDSAIWYGKMKRELMILLHETKKQRNKEREGTAF